MKITKLSESEFAAIGSEWRSLLGQSTVMSPMLAWEWMFSWWESYKELQAPCELYVLGVRDESNILVGVAPFYIRRVRGFYSSVQRIQFLGTGEDEVHETCSELLDIITFPDKENMVAEAVAGYFLENDGWDEILFIDVPDVEQSVVSKVQASMLRNEVGLFSSTDSSGRCPVIKFPESWDEYYEGLGKRTKKLLRYERRRIEKQTKCEFVVHDELESVNKELDKFEVLHQQRWKRDGKPGCFASSVFTDFMQKVIERFSEQSLIQFSTLLINGDMAASFCLLRFKGSLYFYNSAVDLDQYGKLSPGTVGLSYVIEEAITSGFKEFHFFKGRAGSYKERWTSDTVAVSDIVIARKNIGWVVRRGLGALRQFIATKMRKNHKT